CSGGTSSVILNRNSVLISGMALLSDRSGNTDRRPSRPSGAHATASESRPRVRRAAPGRTPDRGSIPALVIGVALIAVARLVARLVLPGVEVLVAPRPMARHARRSASEHRAAAVAQVRPLALEASDDPAHVRNVGRAKPKHV